uniref:RING-type domain-containing protein n=1 Tax=Clytia hemisphaerica TaxID=252671 RepID=A0A7M5WY47_9CNID
MAYYVYPVYVLASLIVLILSIIFTIYSMHFYKFVKSRIVFIKLEPEENNLNNWTFDLYPFTSSRIWKVFGYAIVCLPATFQQASTILVCQCKVIKFKTVLPKTCCDETKGMITPALKKKFLPTIEDEHDSVCKKNQLLEPNQPPIITVKTCCKNEEINDEQTDDCKDELENDVSYDDKNIKESEPLKSSNAESGVKQLTEEPERKKTSLPGKIIQSFRKNHLRSNISESRPKSTIISIDPEEPNSINDPNISIMSIDNLCESEYFIIPEAKPLQTLVVFNEPFNSSCPICLDDFELDEEIALLACHHGYHKDCLNKALRQNASCPYCKSESNVRTFRVSEEIPLLWQTMSRRNSSAVNV